MEELLQAISTLGFPIAVAVAAFVVSWKFVAREMDASAAREQALMEQSTLREEKLGQQLDKFADALNAFNVSLTKIDTRLEIIEKQVHKD